MLYTAPEKREVPYVSVRINPKGLSTTNSPLTVSYISADSAPPAATVTAAPSIPFLSTVRSVTCCIL